MSNLHLQGDPNHEVPWLNVASQVATVLRFEQPINPEKTKMLGWEGRFEPPLACGRFAVLMPLQEVTAEDRFLLLVTLQDGTEVPFTVKGHKDLVDQQVNVFLTPDSTEALRARYENAFQWMKKYKEENERLRKEEASVDHALAALLTQGATRLTPFRSRQHWVTKDEGTGVDLEVAVLSGKSKAAVLFRVTNRDSMTPWKMGHARLMIASQDGEPRMVDLQEKPFAMRMDREEVLAGQSGVIAFVVDKSAFQSEQGASNLALEVFRRGGFRDAYVLLDHRLVRE